MNSEAGIERPRWKAPQGAALRSRASAAAVLAVALVLWGAAVGAAPDDARIPTESVRPETFGDDWTHSEFRRFRIWYPRDYPLAVDALADELNAAQIVAADAFPVPLYFAYDVVAVPQSAEFGRLTGLPPHITQAAAQDHPSVMLLNLASFRATDLAEQRRTLIHELVHLYVSAYAPAPFPLWLEEGIAMHASGEPGPAPGALAMRRYLGGFYSLTDLAGGFPTTIDGRALAYQQSYSVVDFLISEHFPAHGLKGLVGWLLDETAGADRIGRLSDGDYTRALEKRWLSQFRYRVALLTLLMEPTYTWSLGGLLLFAAWLLVRRRRRQQARALGWEDPPPARAEARSLLDEHPPEPPIDPENAPSESLSDPAQQRPRPPGEGRAVSVFPPRRD